ncbi:EAL domain-containing protein [Derxia gummosa]|uniref:EAL domain-containing protein n=1 Tax=Derxia gummosa DSM 723 TaxID=1121388 RepID=A0A8B6X9V9_9BURK|nr:EAL domain-containing protein [Derxia gummosa]
MSARGAELLERALQLDEDTGFAKRSHFFDIVRRRSEEHAAVGASFCLVVVEPADLGPALSLLGEFNEAALLEVVADRLRHFEQTGLDIGRIAQARFALLAPYLADVPHAREIAAQIVDALRPDIAVGAMRLTLDPRAGVAIFPDDAADAAALFGASLAALKHAGEHHESLSMYDRAIGEAQAREARTGMAFRSDAQRLSSVQRDTEDIVLFTDEIEPPAATPQPTSFRLLAEPRIDAATGRVVCIDSQLDWTDPEGRLLGGAATWALARQHGLTTLLGGWWLREGTRAYAEGMDGLRGLPRLGLRIATRLLLRADFGSLLQEQIERAGLRLDQIELGLLAHPSLADNEPLVAQVRALRRAGVRIALDHFGEDEAGLGFLRRFPVDVLKLDAALIARIESDPTDNALLRSILSIARWLDLEVVALGVERDSQRVLLQRLGCRVMQGPLIGAPTALAAAGSLLRPPREGADGKPAEPAMARTLLLLDDEPNILSALRRLLRRDGYTILATTDPAEAFHLLATRPVDVVISDQRMPEMSGTEFLKRVKDLHPGTMRLVLSGYTDVQSITDAINEGAIYKFLTKPWNDEHLRAQIGEAFRRLEIERDNERLRDALEFANRKLEGLNTALETRIEEKTDEILRDLELLNISQEMFDLLPVGVLGVDDSGMIVVANPAASQTLGPAAIPGALVEEVLPAATRLSYERWKRVVDGTAHAPPPRLPANWTPPEAVEASFFRLGGFSRAQGDMIVLGDIGQLPEPGGRLAIPGAHA